jgi:carotenoid cleavage dioxygenase-like enzyme
VLVGLVEVGGVVVEWIGDANEIGRRIVLVSPKHETPFTRDHDVGAPVPDRLRGAHLRDGPDDPGSAACRPRRWDDGEAMISGRTVASSC